MNKKKILTIILIILFIGFVVERINTNKSEFPEDIKEIATSIKQEYKINIDKYEFVSEFCNKFEEKLNERIKKI